MKFSSTAALFGLLGVVSLTHAAPASPSSSAGDDSAPAVSPQFMIDLSVVGTQLAPRDVDINTDHSLEAFNFLGDEAWAIGIRPDSGPVWIHESRWKTVLDDYPPPPNNTTAPAEEDGSALEARQYWGYSSGYYPGYYGNYQYGSGYYGYYAKRDGNDGATGGLEKRQSASCPAAAGLSGSTCTTISNLADSVSMYAYQLLLVSGYIPKMNVYYDYNCNSYMTSVLGSTACLSSTSAIRGVITFNQVL